jgi:hypothetical protein
MEKTRYEVTIYYSSFTTHEIEATSKEEAVLIARNLPIKQDEILMNLENWEDLDESNEIVLQEAYL